MPIKYDMDRDEFDSVEAEMARSINEAGERSGGDATKVALALGGSFLLYRHFMKRRLKEEVAARHLTTADAAGELAVRIFSAYTSKWIPTLAVGLAQGFAAGMREVGVNDAVWAKAASEQYAASLGTGINEVSVEALVDGITSQVNRGVPLRMAVDRAIDAFGVAPRSMKALVNLWTKSPMKGTPDAPKKNNVADQVDQRIAQAISDRAKVVGETESQMSRNASKSMYWAYQAEHGDIPAAAEKEWITADDELTCPVCAPLHHQRVLVTEKFSSSIGKIMAPGIHPRCRCTLKLHLNLDMSDLVRERETVGKSAWGVVHKARGGDQYNRNADGQFATQESRGAGPAGAERKKRFKVYGDNLVRQRQAQQEQKVTPKVTQVVKPAATQAVKPAVTQRVQVKEQVKQTGTKAISTKAAQTAQARTQQIKEHQLNIIQQVIADAQTTQVKNKALHRVGMAGAFAEYSLNDYDSLQRQFSSYETHDYLMEAATEAFSNLQHSSYNEPWDAGADLEDDDLQYGDEPSSDYMSRHENDVYDYSSPSREEGVYEARVSLRNGLNAVLTDETFVDLMFNLHEASDNTIEIELETSGRGHALSGTSSYKIRSSELLDLLDPSVANELVYNAVSSREMLVVADEGAFDDELTLEDRDDTRPLLDVYEQMLNDPWDEDLKDQTYELD